MSELKAISGHEIREDIDYNTRGVDPEDKEWHKYGKELCYTMYYRKSEADKVIAEKDKVIAELKEERRWRKFPEEKPKWCEEVLVVDDESKQYIVRFSHDMKWISWGKMNTCESENVKYWMPLPPAPKEAK